MLGLRMMTQTAMLDSDHPAALPDPPQPSLRPDPDKLRALTASTATDTCDTPMRFLRVTADAQGFVVPQQLPHPRYPTTYLGRILERLGSCIEGRMLERPMMSDQLSLIDAIDQHRDELLYLAPTDNPIRRTGIYHDTPCS